MSEMPLFCCAGGRIDKATGGVSISSFSKDNIKIMIDLMRGLCGAWPGVLPSLLKATRTLHK